MNKILLLIDPEHFNPSILNFVRSIVLPEQSKIIGVLLNQSLRDALPGIKSIGGQLYVEEITLSAEDIDKKRETLHNVIGAFKCDCLALGLRFETHNNVYLSAKDIIKESRYADMIIADCLLSIEGDDALPSKLLVELLKQSECPVLIAPQQNKPIEKIVFAYDGSKSSMFAIRQFYHCLPHLSSKQLTVLHVNNGKELPASKMQLLDEWLKLTVSSYTYEQINGEAESELFSYFLSKSEHSYSLLIAGAFGRNTISSFLQGSTLGLSLKALDVPTFITHL